jgi:DNA-directed RNA polymerase subunit RPC12/RpoP
MVQAAHAFDARVRVLECANCGAPATTLPVEESFRCAYCGAANVFRRVVHAPSVAPVEGAPQNAAASSDEQATRAIEQQLVRPDRVAWARAAAAKPAARAYDVSRNPPADLVAMAGRTDWNTWVGTWLPALRQHWQSALPREGATVAGAPQQHRLY